MTVCSQPKCDAPVVARGLCQRHYSQERRGRLGMDAEPKPGDPSGLGRYGVIDRDEDSIACHECGERLVMLGPHLRRAHEMTVAEYRAEHGLPRTVGLVSLGEARALSERASERVGSPGWQRFEARRDPLAASQSRDEDAFRAPALVAHATEAGRTLSAAQRGTGAVKTCPACGGEYRGRRRTCSRACARRVIVETARAQPRPRDLTPDEAVQLRAAIGDLGPMVRRLQAAGVSSQSIARSLGRSPSWVSERWPKRP